ncbi:MAG: hypothetical protein ACRDH8_15380 [Actinomycetota bacterium]
MIVAFLFWFTYRTETRVEGLSPDPDVTIRVTAFRWSWRFDYQGEGVCVFGTPDDPPEMVVPVGWTVRIVLTSTDVIHCFFVRDFAFKRDAIPGRVTRFDLTWSGRDSTRAKCAEICGLAHYQQRFTVRAVSPSYFEGGSRTPAWPRPREHPGP